MNCFKPYWANFRLGIRLTLNNRSDLCSVMVIYGVLLLVFHAVFSAFPMDELGHAELTAGHLLWYLAVTELVVVSAQGNERELGNLIADGQITTLMQRPHHMMGLLLARLMGNVFVCAATFTVMAMVIVPLLTDTALPMALDRLPLFVISVALGTVIFILCGYAIGMTEVLGPYSRSMGWIMNKLIMALGGLFFPVMFYPEGLQKLLAFTPFPAILTVPGNFMLVQNDAVILHGLLQQLMWLFIMFAVAAMAERRMIRHVMVKGD